MYTSQVEIKNKSGLHARPASDFIAAAKQFESKITICNAEKPDEAGNAKSIVILLSLGLGQGTVVEITADGSDEIEAVDKLVQLIESKFGEE